QALRDDTLLVSIIAANGEIGTLQPIREIGRIAHARGVPFHVDAVGAAGRVPIQIDDCRIDLLTLSSNDLYGPPGAGALWVGPGVKADGVLLELGLRGVAASSGAICTAMTGEPSHVLRAIGCDRETAEGSLCFTLGRWTTAGEIEIVLDTVPVVVARLRRLA